jgi:hypothetical protein
MHRKMTSAPTPFAVGAENYKKNKKNTNSPSEDRGSHFKLAFQKIVLKMLASDPADRYQNADQLLNEIKQLKGIAPEKNQQNQQLVPLPVPESGKGPLPKVLAIAAACAALAACAGMVYFSDSQHSPVTPVIPTTVAPAAHDTDNTMTEQQAASTKIGAPGPGKHATEEPLAGSDSEPVMPKKGFLIGSRLRYWKDVQRAGQEAFQAGDLVGAGKYFEAGLKQADQLKGPDRVLAVEVSLSDLIDIATARGNSQADQVLWQRYQAMIQDRSKAIHSMNQPLIGALGDILLAYDAGESPSPKQVDKLIAETFDKVKVEYADERFGDMAQLLNHALPVLQRRKKGDGSLAYAYHTMSSLSAAEDKWKEALNYANLAYEASQGHDKILQTNMAQALYFRGWAKSCMGDSPVDCYNEALAIDAKIGAANNMSRLAIYRKLAHYYVSTKQIEQANAIALSGIKLAEEGKFADRSESKRLDNLAFYYSVVGRLADAIKAANNGLRIEDCTLPRQDYRVMEELESLARYYKANGQHDLAGYARSRADAIKMRLKEFDQIYKPSP